MNVAGCSVQESEYCEQTGSNIGIADSESNEIHRFELLRNELMELEKRFQRSADQSENGEVYLILLTTISTFHSSGFILLDISMRMIPYMYESLTIDLSFSKIQCSVIFLCAFPITFLVCILGEFCLKDFFLFFPFICIWSEYSYLPSIVGFDFLLCI